jgi:hypothetical protein
VGEEFVDGAGEEHFALLNEVGAVDEAEDFAGVVVGDEYADPFGAEVADEVFEVLDGDGVDVGKGFVEEEEGGVGDEGAGDFEAAPLAAREGRGFFARVGSEVELGEELFEALGTLGGGEGERFEDGEDVLFDSEGAEDGGFLGKVAEAHPGPFMNGEAGDVLPLEKDVPFVGSDEADGHVKGGGFAGAVGSKQPDDFSWIDREGESADDRFSSVVFDEVA